MKSTDNQTGRYVRRITWIGLGLNLALSLLKFIAGILGNSHAVAADAVHSLSDSTTDIAVIIGSYFWDRPPDAGHPYGHQRIETLITVFIGLALAAAGIGIGVNALADIPRPAAEAPKHIALFAAMASIIIKEGLYRYTEKAGRRVKSTALAANAWHHRLDALSSLPVAVAVAGGMVHPPWRILDPVGAVVVSVFILYSASKIITSAMKSLIDAGGDEKDCRIICETAAAHPDVLDVHKLRTRYLGRSLIADLHVVVDGKISVREGHDIAEAVKNEVIEKGPDVVDVVVHIEPD